MSSSESSPRSRWAFSDGLRAVWRSRIGPWILTYAAILLTALVLASVTGCTRTILVPEASPIRIGPETRTRVYVLDGGEWVLSENRVMIPEGWYCVPPSFVEEDRDGS